MPNEDVMRTGFLAAGFAWTLWWNIDWRRFIKFYEPIVPKAAPYRRWVEIGLRIFFALCSLGAGGDLWQQLFHGTRPDGYYRQVLVVAAIWSAVIFAMVHAVEWLNSMRKR